METEWFFCKSQASLDLFPVSIEFAAIKNCIYWASVKIIIVPVYREQKDWEKRWITAQKAVISVQVAS